MAREESIRERLSRSAAKLRSTAWNWNATERDWWAFYPCDRHIHSPYREMMRAIDIEAPLDVVYRWICQLKVAPYSYDWLDNFGRRSPRRPTPGADELAVGQNFMVGPIVEFEKDHHITAAVDPRFARLYGYFSMTYLVRPTGPASCHLVVKGDLECSRWWERVRVFLLVWGDLVMMRKQLLTLKALAEQTAHEESGAGRAAVPAAALEPALVPGHPLVDTRAIGAEVH